MTRKSIAILVATSMLGACSYGFRGPTPVLSPSGVVAEDRGRPRVEFFFNRFRDLAYQAAGCRLPDAAGPATRCDDENLPATEAGRADLMRRYMRAGFALVYADCDEYMSVMARHQGRSRIGRDLIAPIAALITGIISLRNLADGDEQGWLTRLALGTAASTSALDIVDQRFLFGSDNVDAVRGRVTRALDEQGDGALARPPAELNFERASREIINNQALCRPSGILTLTRNAIQSAPVIARNS